MTYLIRAAIVVLATAVPATAEIARTQVEGDVAPAMDRVEMAVLDAGATVFARINHGAGAAMVNQELGDSELLIFGNPALGTPAMQADPLAGLFLPLKVMVYADGDGQTWVAYEEITDTFDGLDVPADAEFIAKMSGALSNFAAKAEVSE